MDLLTQELVDVLDTENRSTLPPHFYHLGFRFVVTVCVINDKVSVKFTQYGKDSSMSIKEIVFSRFTWASLDESMDSYTFVDLPSSCDSISLVNNQLFFAVIDKDDTKYITVQRCITKSDYSRSFFLPVIFFSESQWDTLKTLRKNIRQSICSIMFSEEFRESVISESEKYLPFSKCEGIDQFEAEITLTTSLCDLLKSHLEECISDIRECNGCIHMYENQLGHECMTMTKEEVLDKYFNLAIAKFDMKKIAKAFVYDNNEILKYLSIEFLETLDVTNILKTVRLLFLA